MGLIMSGQDPYRFYSDRVNTEQGATRHLYGSLAMMSLMRMHDIADVAFPKQGFDVRQQEHRWSPHPVAVRYTDGTHHHFGAGDDANTYELFIQLGDIRSRGMNRRYVLTDDWAGHAIYETYADLHSYVHRAWPLRAAAAQRAINNAYSR